jgi:hypothetical protein
MKNSELLEELRRLRRLYDNLKKERAEMCQELGWLKSLDYSKTRITGGKVHDVSDELMRLENRQEHNAGSLITLYNEITELETYFQTKLKDCPDPDGVAVLHNLYVLNGSVADTEKATHYSQRTIYRKRNYVLEYLDAMPCDYDGDGEKSDK